MSSTQDSEVSLRIFGMVSASLGLCSLLFCCVTYIISRKKTKQQNQIRTSNQHHDPAAQRHIFTIDMAEMPHSDPAFTDRPPDIPPPPYESTGGSLLTPQDEPTAPVLPKQQPTPPC